MVVDMVVSSLAVSSFLKFWQFNRTGALPPPLWGRVGERGDRESGGCGLPPSLTLPHKGGGNGKIPPYRTASAPTGSACTRGTPRLRASSSAVGQESAGRLYLICIAFTALRLCWPITPSTLPTL